MNSPIFIVGCPRSGTHLLRNLLRRHPNLTFPGESHFIPKFYKVFGEPKNESEVLKLAETILGLQWVRSWDLQVKPGDFVDCRSYSELVSGVFEAWAKKENKPRWGDKTPQYVTDIPIFVELFPACKIVHIIRDGRDVALSWLQVNFGPKNVFTAASAWKHFVQVGREAGKKLKKESYLEVQYEELLRHPVEIMTRICEFIDEPFYPEVLNPLPFYLIQNERGAIFGAPHNKLESKAEIDTGNLEKWKTRMSPADRILFESVAGNLLNSLGYATEGKIRRINKTEHMLWKTHHCFWWTLKKLNSKNKYRWLKTDLLLRWLDIRYRVKRINGVLD